MTPVTVICPVVTVPVLSSTTVSIARDDSSAWYPLMKTPSCAPRPDATTRAAGVASPSAHGQAMISTASAALNACPAVLPASSHPASVGRRTGQHARDEHRADPVGETLDARLPGLRLLDQRDQVSKLGVPAHLDRAHHQTAGQDDGAAGHAVTRGCVDGDRFSGHHAPVDGGLAGQNLTVGGNPLPRPHHETLAGLQQAGRDPLLGVVVAEHAHVLGPGRGQIPHGLTGAAPGPGLVQPPGQQERGD